VVVENLPYQRDVDEVLGLLKSRPTGLSEAEAQQRLTEFGLNELQVKKKKTAFMMLLDQFKDFMILVLMGAAVVAGVIGELADTLVIITIVVINAIIGFVQEYRAERAMEADRKSVV
jgi:P-type Ca2+ transporter type 2C